jgi:uncharacterized protein YybS (DUF2232 family)
MKEINLWQIILVIFVAVVGVVILVYLYQVIRSYFRWKKKYSKDGNVEDNKEAGNKE